MSDIFYENGKLMKEINSQTKFLSDLAVMLMTVSTCSMDTALSCVQRIYSDVNITIKLQRENNMLTGVLADYMDREKIQELKDKLTMR